MNRHRWFSVGLGLTLPKFLKKLEKVEFREGCRFGFISIESDRLDRFCFQLLRKTVVQIPFLGASGKMEYRGIDALVDLKFELFEKNGRIWLKIEDPPRSIKEFMNVIEGVAGFGFSAEPYIFSTTSQKSALERFENFRLVGFRGLGNSIQNKLIVRLDAVSKEGLEPERLDLIKGLNFKMDQTTYEVSHKMLKGQVTFLASGLVRTVGAVTPYLVDSLECALW